MTRARRLAVDWLLPAAAGVVLWLALSGRLGPEAEPVARVLWALAGIAAAFVLVRGVVLVGGDFRRGWGEAGRKRTHA